MRMAPVFRSAKARYVAQERLRCAGAARGDLPPARHRAPRHPRLRRGFMSPVPGRTAPTRSLLFEAAGRR